MAKLSKTGGGESAASRRKPRQQRAKEKVEKILTAARRLLEAEGPAAFNTNRIAKEAGVGVGTLYEYFPGKDAIAGQLQESISEVEATQVLERFAELGEATFDQLIPALVELTFSIYRSHLALRVALWAMAPGDRSIGHRPAERQVIGVIAERLRAMEDGADVTLRATVAFHIVESLSTQLLADGRWSDQACIEEVVKAVRAYLGR